MWDLIVSIPDHCLSFYFTHILTRPKFISGDNYGASGNGWNVIGGKFSCNHRGILFISRHLVANSFCGLIWFNLL